MMETLGYRLEELTWPEVRPALQRPRVGVLPIGSAAKAHGPHLPMHTDWLQAEALGLQLARRAPAVVWPTLGYGYYPAFTEYAGSTNVREAEFRAVVKQLLADLVRAGAQAVLVLNTGISTIGPVEDAIADLPLPADAVHVYRSERHARVRRAVLEQSVGGHADEAETSVMLHLHPELVRLEDARAWTRPMTAGVWSPDDPSHPRYSPHGVYGDPTRATATKGRELFEAMVDELEERLLTLVDDAGPRS